MDYIPTTPALIVEHLTDNMDVKVDSGLDNVSSDSYLMDLFSWWRIFWYSKLICCCILAALCGYYLIHILRQYCKKTEKLWKLTFLVFAAPITLHIFMATLYYCGICGRVFSDTVSFGFVGGIILKLASKPSGEGTVKLIVQQVGGSRNDVWLDSTDLAVGEVRNKIADSLKIVPANRVSIESGKGTFLEDLSKPLFIQLDDSCKTTDLFGFVTATCYVSIRPEDLRPKVSFQDGGETRTDKKSPNPFRGLLRSEIKYGDMLNLTAKIEGGAQNFHINLVDKFAAAAPAGSSTQLASVQVRLLSWSAIEEAAAAIGDGVSVAESVSSSATHSKRNSRTFGVFSRRRCHSDDVINGACSMAGKAVRNGDTVVIEAGGKFMSVTRGWWMAWSSADPRRSGAFVVEIVEKAPQNKLVEFTEQIKGRIDNINQKIGRGSVHTKDVDNALRPGDLFRLRSVKFPEFELGITSVTLRDEFCYLGLKKIGEESNDRNNNGDSDWCMGVRFSVRNHTLGDEILNQIKITV